MKSAVSTRCKCHGISGSCTVRTCWRQLTAFLQIGNLLKQKYENSYKVVTYTNHATGNSPLSDDITLENNSGNILRPVELQNLINDNDTGRDRKSKKSKRDKNSAKEGEEFNIAPRSDMMVYLDHSPTFCEPSPYSLGTSGRVCDKSNCEIMCCGRGYNIRSVTVKRACQCQVLWCCDVKCKQCVSEKEVFLCK